MQLKSFSFKTKDGFEHWVNRWIPDSNVQVKAIIQLHHGIAEHSLRYDRFGSILADEGFVLNGYDMRGHGKTGELAEANGSGIKGKIANKNGDKIVVQDLYEMIEDVKKEYPNVPVIIFSHSFGTFVAQGFLQKYSDLVDGAILSGTAGPERAKLFFSKFAVCFIKLFSGNNKNVKLLDKIAFGTFNKDFESEGKNAWISSDNLSVQMHDMDTWCDVSLKASFYKDLTTLLNKIYKKSNMKKIKKDLPILISYGTKDPVGQYGKTVEKLIGEYKTLGLKNLSVLKYENVRHELLNEVNKEQVEKDFIEWIRQVLPS